MIDDREAQAAVLARARANPASGLPLAVQDHIGIQRRLHGDGAADELMAAYKRLPSDKRYCTKPAEALAAKARHDADQAAFSKRAEILDLENDPPCFGE